MVRLLRTKRKWGYDDENKSDRLLRGTTFLLFNILAGAIAELVQRKDNVEGMLLLGYPLYFMTILGIWKATLFVVWVEP
jgi:preprotein translocase subunit SecY